MINRLSEEMISYFFKNCSEKMTLAIPKNAKVLPEHPTSYATWVRIRPTHYVIRCSCNGFSDEMQNVEDVCPVCGNEAKFIFSKDDCKMLEDAAIDYGAYNGHSQTVRGYVCGNSPTWRNGFKVISNKHEVFSVYYVRERMDGEVGIEMVQVTGFCHVSDDGDFVFTERYSSWADVIPGKKIAAYKVTKARGVEEISMFDAFHISNNNAIKDVNIYFEGATSMIDFLFKYSEFGKRTGLSQILMNYHCDMPENSFFLLYMCLLNEYPVVEIIAKMGYYSLIFSMMNEILNHYTRTAIKEQVDKLSNLLSRTVGKNVLSIPKHIGSFLNSKGTDFNEYMAWALINEREPISEDKFSSYVQSEEYLYMNFYDVLVYFPDIMKYGYTLNEVSRYLVSQSRYLFPNKMKSEKITHPVYITAQMWKDYLEMCEMLGVEPARKPKNLRTVHDDTAKVMSFRNNAEAECKVELLAQQYSGFKSKSEHYVVVFPKCSQDFLNEGNAMHNCVGGYFNKVVRDDCRIFFIRRKEDPDKSYITGECKKTGLGQLFYRSNQPVNNYFERQFAEAVCSHILSMRWSPTDEALKKRVKEKSENIDMSLKTS